MPYWDHKRGRRKNCVSLFYRSYSNPSHYVTAPVGHGKDSPKPLFRPILESDIYIAFKIKRLQNYL